MDDWVTWLQAKLGPMTFGTLAGFIMQVSLFRPPSWFDAFLRALVAVAAATVFTSPVMALLQAISQKIGLPLNLDTDSLRSLSAALLALGGDELIRRIRRKVVKVADSDGT